MKSSGQKSQFLSFLVNYGKVGSTILVFQKSQFSFSFMNLEKPGSIHSPRPTFPNPNFESKDKLGKVMS